MLAKNICGRREMKVFTVNSRPRPAGQDGAQAFLDGKYKAEGDIGLMNLFGK
jgi:hypothetical protein